jgi:hypothetical protein
MLNEFQFLVFNKNVIFLEGLPLPFLFVRDVVAFRTNNLSSSYFIIFIASLLINKIFILLTINMDINAVLVAVSWLAGLL